MSEPVPKKARVDDDKESKDSKESKQSISLDDDEKSDQDVTLHSSDKKELKIKRKAAMMSNLVSHSFSLSFLSAFSSLSFV
jgi:hypothetical protein